MSTLTAFDFCKIEGHVRPVNPRHLAAFDGAGACSRCGRRLEADEMTRDVEKEREWTREAAQYAQYVANPDEIAEALSSFREVRMGSGPWRDVSSRDWITEALEECADLSAYIIAALQELELEERDDEDALKCWMLLRMALAASVTAYSSLGGFRHAAL